MSLGIIEVITLLLGLTGFGVSPNPRAATVDQALAYAIADADVVVHLDAASVIPGNYKLLAQLPEQAQVKASPELGRLVHQGVAEIEGARAMARLATGIDFATDIADATAFVQIVPQGPVRFVVAVHGKLAAMNLEKLARPLGRKVEAVGAGSIAEGASHEPALAITGDGVALIGTAELVRERLAATWKPPAHDAGTNLGFAAEQLAGRPVFAAVMALSQDARGEALASTSAPGLLADLIARHQAAALAIFRDGVGFTWVDRSKPGLDAMEQMTSGVIEILRALHIAPRGAAKIALAALDAYRGSDPRIDELIKRKADIARAIESTTGDGNFKVAMDKNARKLRLSVRATGKTLSEVLPLGALLPVAAAALLDNRDAAAPPSAPAHPAPPAARPTRK